MRHLPPIQPGEVYVRCPSCGLIGWTTDEPDEPPPDCPVCDTAVDVFGTDEGEVPAGQPDIRITDGAPVDGLHHLRGETLDRLA